MDISVRTILKVLATTAMFVGVLVLAYMVRSELTWIGIAFFLAVALNPAVEFLSRFMPRRNRGLAIAAVFAIMLLLVAFLLVSFVPPLIEQSKSLAIHLPKQTDQLVHGNGFVSEQIRHYNLVDRIRESQDQIAHYVSSAGSQFFSVMRDIFSSLVAGITVLGLTFFMLLEGPAWIRTFWTFFPKKHRDHARNLADQMYKTVTGYVGGNLLTSLIAAAATSIVLAIVHVPYAIPLGILVGILDLLPLVGATIGAIAVIAISLFYSVTAAIVMIIFFLVYQQLENHVLQPIVYGKTVDISPLVVLVAVLIGAAAFGILGAIVAIPVFASLQILVKDYAKRRLGKS